MINDYYLVRRILPLGRKYEVLAKNSSRHRSSGPCRLDRWTPPPREKDQSGLQKPAGKKEKWFGFGFWLQLFLLRLNLDPMAVRLVQIFSIIIGCGNFAILFTLVGEGAIFIFRVPWPFGGPDADTLTN
ncbi:hypothetical protein BO94DRAFT_39565 [Aspergillus sclerotioniger CBS 115572]|uniref:Uncharacterized protein n=1 Tax=Aspergillus sclerotioniger CBS 115572 TaxID=1450535 RepID=A0A317WTW7_9EURO|nr:hypothetical protein BO94DRAFT_39565 [Aspergillus sclerotioniger CBS 115572]PWY89535.1 hypothetical protein BO94DRAFT_39565 [Aspergillus sclerotioniger CBS 115572]